MPRVLRDIKDIGGIFERSNFFFSFIILEVDMWKKGEKRGLCVKKNDCFFHMRFLFVLIFSYEGGFFVEK